MSEKTKWNRREQHIWETIRNSGIDPKRVALDTGINEANLRRYKPGVNVTFDNMCKIADALDCPLSDLYDEERD